MPRILDLMEFAKNYTNQILIGRHKCITPPPYAVNTTHIIVARPCQVLHRLLACDDVANGSNFPAEIRGTATIPLVLPKLIVWWLKSLLRTYYNTAFREIENSHFFFVRDSLSRIYRLQCNGFECSGSNCTWNWIIYRQRNGARILLFCSSNC